MPNADANTMHSETQQLTEKIEQNRMRYEQTINRLRDEKCAFEEAQRERYLLKKERIEKLLTQIQQQESLNQSVVADHVNLLAEHELSERLA